MKKSIIPAILAIASIFQPSCSKNEIADSHLQQSSSRVKLTAQFEKAAKTTLDTETGVVSWVAGDKLTFVWNQDDVFSSCVSDELRSEGISQTSATFYAAIPEDFSKAESKYESRNLYSVYPSSVAVEYGEIDKLYVTVPAQQDGSFTNAGIAVARWNSEAAGSPLEFKNLCGLFQFTVSDSNISKVVFSSSSVIAGKAAVSFDKDGNPVATAPKNGEKEITLSVNGAGVYYIAVLPSTLDGLYIAQYDGSDVLVGDRMSGKLQAISRNQVRNLGTIPSGFEGRYFVTPEGRGEKDGTSWENAADLAGLSTKLQATNGALKVYLAKGQYNVTSVIKPGKSNKSADIEIYGGYPDDAEGCSLAGRDVKANATVFDGGGTQRLFVVQRGKWRFDGITFQHAKVSSGNGTGTAMIIEGDDAAEFNYENCRFLNNENSSADGGAVRVSYGEGFSRTTVNMTRCEFSGNVSSFNGGAICHSTGTLVLDHCTFSADSAAVNGGAITTDADLTIKDCDFDKNGAKTSGGALNVNSNAFVKIDGGIFTENNSWGENKDQDGGGAIFIAKGSSGKVFMNRCFLAGNMAKKNAFAIYVAKTSGTLGSLAMNNCVIRSPWDQSIEQGSLMQIKGYHVISNSTLYSRTGKWGSVSLGSKIQDGCTIVNDIIVNGSTNQYSFHVSSYYVNVSYSLYSKVDATNACFKIDSKTCLGDIQCQKDGGNFPTAANEWVANRSGERFYLADGRSMYCYPWPGTTTAGTVHKPTLAQVEAKISATAVIGEEFLAWLKSDDLKINGKTALEVDIRGVGRNTSAMWPGSYQND